MTIFTHTQQEVTTMNELTDERLAELRTIAGSAAAWFPGQWEHLPGIDWEARVASKKAFIADVGSPVCAEHIAAFDPPTALALLAEVERLRNFAQLTQERDWQRLDRALEHAINGIWSMQCGWIVGEIIDAHAVTGTWTPETAILYGPLLLDGIYEAITGIPVSEETLAGCRNYFAPYERHVFAGSAAEAKKAAEQARRELGKDGQQEWGE